MLCNCLTYFSQNPQIRNWCIYWWELCSLAVHYFLRVLFLSVYFCFAHQICAHDNFSGKSKQMQAIYTLTKTIQSKIFNYKEFIKTLDTKDILDNMKNLPCNQLHNITIYRSKPWAYCAWRYMYCPKQQIKETVIQRSQIHREPVSINFSNCKTKIKNSLTKFSSDWCNKKRVSVKCFIYIHIR